MSTLRLVHLSDIHFAVPSFNPNQFLSKQWIGNLNLLFFRRKTCDSRHIWKLIQLFHALKVDAVCITGDLTTTSQSIEFAKAQDFVKELQQLYPVFLIPGNHDCYTKKAQQAKLYYQFFPSTLSNTRIESRILMRNWWYIGLDTTVATMPFFAYGEFFKSLHITLRHHLTEIPANFNILIANHFPLFSTGHPRHDLKNHQDLQSILKSFPQVKVYLHGHDHESYTIDGRKEKLPLTINAGSCSLIERPSFLLLDLTHDECVINKYCYDKEWTKDTTSRYSISSDIFSTKEQ